jgi:hypothetical protein
VAEQIRLRSALGGEGVQVISQRVSVVSTGMNVMRG